ASVSSGLWSPSSARLRYYYLVTEPKTWVQAQSYCRQKYTDLATVDNMAEMEELQGFIPPGFSDSIWIGLKRGPMRLWGWSSGEVLQYTNWNPGEPNGVVTDRWCGAIYKLGGWIDTSCTNMFKFICYSEPLGKFVLVKIASNWRDAETYCRQYYTNLATIHSDQEQQDVRDLLTDSDIVWIGLGFDNWLWSDGSKTTFRYWHPGQPYSATDDGNCAMVSTSWGGDWDDTACNGVMSFMCYKGQSEHFLSSGCRWYQYLFS
ncbi:C-type mannose receptor 2-like, partial [Astyanax mexicanus]